MTDKEKLREIKVLADAMYNAAQYLTTDASRLHDAMEKYHQFVINEYYKEEPVNEDLEKVAIELWAVFEKGWKSKDESAVKSCPDEIWLYDYKPVKDEYGYPADVIGGIDARFIPSITETNSPKKVRITIEDINYNDFIGEDVTDEITGMSPISQEPLATLKIE